MIVLQLHWLYMINVIYENKVIIFKSITEGRFEADRIYL